MRRTISHGAEQVRIQVAWRHRHYRLLHLCGPLRGSREQCQPGTPQRMLQPVPCRSLQRLMCLTAIPTRSTDQRVCGTS